MSAFNPVSNGTFEVLDDLQDDGRRRYLKRRSKEELEEILVAAWRERDKTKVHDGNPLTKAVDQIRVPAVTLNRQDTNLDAAEEAVGITQLSQAQTELPENRGEKRNAPESTSTTQPPQKQHTGATKTGIARCFSEQDNQGNQDVQEPTQRHVQDLKAEMQETKYILEQLDYLTETDGEGSMLLTHKPYDGGSRELPILLYVPDNEGSGYYADIDQLPIKVHIELKRRFDTLCNSSAHKSRCFKRLTNNCKTYIDRPWCICDQIVRGLSLKQYGRPTAAQKFTQGGKLRFRADDRCIENKTPCAHLIEHEGGYAIFFVPLPKREKIANWMELGFWVED